MKEKSIAIATGYIKAIDNKYFQQFIMKYVLNINLYYILPFQMN